jgi:tetratricopeptide (TPR) repeat protein
MRRAAPFPAALFIALQWWHSVDQTGRAGLRKPKKRGQGKNRGRPANSPGNAADAALREAVALHQSGQFSEAETRYLEIIENTPASADAHHLLGVIFHQTKRSGEAIPLIEKALSLGGPQPVFYANLGVALISLERFGEAADALAESIRLNSSSADARNNMGLALKALGKHREAIESFEACIRLDPVFARARSNLGTLHNERGFNMQEDGHAGDAAESYRRAIEIDPDYEVSRFNIGVALASLGQFQEAVDAYRGALEISPDYADAHYNLGMVLLLLGRLEEGWPHYEWRKKSRGWARGCPSPNKPSGWTALLSMGNTFSYTPSSDTTTSFSLSVTLRISPARARGWPWSATRASGTFSKACRGSGAWPISRICPRSIFTRS